MRALYFFKQRLNHATFIFIVTFPDAYTYTMGGFSTSNWYNFVYNFVYNFILYKIIKQEWSCKQGTLGKTSIYIVDK